MEKPPRALILIDAPPLTVIVALQFIDDSKADVLAHMDFPASHRAKLHLTNPLERLNKEVKRRADVVGTFPNEGSVAPPTILQLSSGKRWYDVILCTHGMAKVFGLAC